jgi:hypothetical protein
MAIAHFAHDETGFVSGAGIQFGDLPTQPLQVPLGGIISHIIPPHSAGRVVAVGFRLLITTSRGPDSIEFVERFCETALPDDPLALEDDNARLGEINDGPARLKVDR